MPKIWETVGMMWLLGMKRATMCLSCLTQYVLVWRSGGVTNSWEWLWDAES